MGIRSYYHEFRKRLKENGLITTILFSIRYLKNNPMSILRGTHYQTHKRVDNDHRWDLIQDSIDPDDHNILDIGCAEGLFTSHLANAGLFAIGIDKTTPRLSAAQRSAEFDEGIGFVEYEISPDTIHKLPEFDIVLLLTVYHHWWRDYGYGWEDAEKMLQMLVANSGKLVIEIPEEPVDKPGFDTDPPVRNQYEAYFNDVLDNANLEYLDRVAYKGGDRNDLMFLIS